MEKYKISLDEVKSIVKLLSAVRFPLNNEKELQAAIEMRFKHNYIVHRREHELDRQNIVDFFLPGGLAIEVKIKANKMEIYKQCERYCQFDEVKFLILVTNTSIGFPVALNGKPCFVINLGKGWL